MTVELDSALGGRAVQYREVQGHETEKFLSYFKPCIIPQEGGVASGFNHVKPEEHQTRLYICKGKHVVRVKEASQLACLEMSFLLTGPLCFILVCIDFLIHRFRLFDRLSTTKTFSFLIQSLKFFNSMVPNRVFKKEQKLLRLFSTLKTLTMMENAISQLLVSEN